MCRRPGEVVGGIPAEQNGEWTAFTAAWQPLDALFDFGDLPVELQHLVREGLDQSGGCLFAGHRGVEGACSVLVAAVESVFGWCRRRLAVGVPTTWWSSASSDHIT
ncbi:hypothetical protein OG411_05550 [Streptomyces pseudogriseolus]|uniref:hypothetical protein n=1 Tax=Streptomyces pseudogriseolus TaxID=36817 RepID=UPI003243547D